MHMLAGNKSTIMSLCQLRMMVSRFVVSSLLATFLQQTFKVVTHLKIGKT